MNPDEDDTTPEEFLAMLNKTDVPPSSVPMDAEPMPWQPTGCAACDRGTAYERGKEYIHNGYGLSCAQDRVT